MFFLAVALAVAQSKVPHIQPLSRLMVAVEAESTPVASTQEFQGVLAPEVAFDRVLPSWNAKHRLGKLQLKVRVIGETKRTEWISVTGADARGPQWAFSNGELRLAFPGVRLEYRANYVPSVDGNWCLTLLAFNFANSKFFGPSGAPRRNVAWGRQVSFPEGRESWSAREPAIAVLLAQFRELLVPVPSSKPSNLFADLAYASSQGMGVAYQTRLTSIDDLEPWIAWEIPVVCWIQRTAAVDPVILLGFSHAGDPIVVRSTGQPLNLSRNTFEQLWLKTCRRVVMIYPSVVYTPADSKSLWLMGHGKDAPNHLTTPSGGGDSPVRQP
jgi:hypothetical protein